MTDFYSTPRHRFPTPSLQVRASAGIDDAQATVILAHRSDSSPEVLDQAIAGARRENAAVRAVLLESDTTTAPSAGTLSQTKELADSLAEAGLEFEIQRADSDVASQIIDLAEAWQATLIVMPSKRRSPVVKLLLGSSTQRVILEAQCPLLIVKWRVLNYPMAWTVSVRSCVADRLTVPADLRLLLRSVRHREVRSCARSAALPPPACAAHR